MGVLWCSNFVDILQNFVIVCERAFAVEIILQCMSLFQSIVFMSLFQSNFISDFKLHINAS